MSVRREYVCVLCVLCVRAVRMLCVHCVCVLCTLGVSAAVAVISRFPLLSSALLFFAALDTRTTHTHTRAHTRTHTDRANGHSRQTVVMR